MKKEKTKEATNLQDFFKNNHNEIIKHLIELYEFQENIKIEYSIKTKEA